MMKKIIMFLFIIFNLTIVYGGFFSNIQISRVSEDSDRGKIIGIVNLKQADRYELFFKPKDSFSWNLIDRQNVKYGDTSVISTDIGYNKPGYYEIKVDLLKKEKIVDSETYPLIIDLWKPFVSLDVISEKTNYIAPGETVQIKCFIYDEFPYKEPNHNPIRYKLVLKGDGGYNKEIHSGTVQYERYIDTDGMVRYHGIYNSVVWNVSEQDILPGQYYLELSAVDHQGNSNKTYYDLIIYGYEESASNYQYLQEHLFRAEQIGPIYGKIVYKDTNKPMVNGIVLLHLYGNVYNMDKKVNWRNYVYRTRTDSAGRYYFSSFNNIMRTEYINEFDSLRIFKVWIGSMELTVIPDKILNYHLKQIPLKIKAKENEKYKVVESHTGREHRADMIKLNIELDSIDTGISKKYFGEWKYFTGDSLPLSVINLIKGIRILGQYHYNEVNDTVVKEIRKTWEGVYRDYLRRRGVPNWVWLRHRTANQLLGKNGLYIEPYFQYKDPRLQFYPNVVKEDHELIEKAIIESGNEKLDDILGYFKKLADKPYQYVQPVQNRFDFMKYYKRICSVLIDDIDTKLFENISNIRIDDLADTLIHQYSSSKDIHSIKRKLILKYLYLTLIQSIPTHLYQIYPDGNDSINRYLEQIDISRIKDIVTDHKKEIKSYITESDYGINGAILNCRETIKDITYNFYRIAGYKQDINDTLSKSLGDSIVLSHIKGSKKIIDILNSRIPVISFVRNIELRQVEKLLYYGSYREGYHRTYEKSDTHPINLMMEFSDTMLGINIFVNDELKYRLSEKQTIYKQKVKLDNIESDIEIKIRGNDVNGNQYLTDIGEIKQEPLRIAGQNNEPIEIIFKGNKGERKDEIKEGKKEERKKGKIEGKIYRKHITKKTIAKFEHDEKIFVNKYGRVQSAKEILPVEYRNKARILSTSPDNEYMLIYEPDKKGIRLIDKSGNIISDDKIVQDEEFNKFKMNHNGQVFHLKYHDLSIINKKGKILKNIGGVKRYEISSDGNYMAVITGSSEIRGEHEKVILFNENGKKLFENTVYEGTKLRVGKNGEFVIVGSDNGNGRIFNKIGKEILRVCVDAPPHIIYHIDLSEDNKISMFASDRVIAIADNDAPELIKKYYINNQNFLREIIQTDHPEVDLKKLFGNLYGDIEKAKLSPDGKYLFVVFMYGANLSSRIIKYITPEEWLKASGVDTITSRNQEVRLGKNRRKYWLKKFGKLSNGEGGSILHGAPYFEVKLIGKSFSESGRYLARINIATDDKDVFLLEQRPVGLDVIGDVKVLLRYDDGRVEEYGISPIR